MTLSQLWLAVMLVLFISDDVVDGRCSGFCGDTNKTLNSHRIKDNIYIKGAEFMKLTCCTSDFLSITWQKFNKTSKIWVSYPWFPTDNDYTDIPNHELCDNGQVFVVRSTSHWDAGHYRCNVRTAASVFRKEYRVHFIRCEDIHGQIVAIDQPPDIMRVKQDYNVTLVCRGYFGCRDSTNEKRGVNWSYLTTDGREYFLNNRSHDRYHLSQTHSRDDIIKDSILDISLVRSSDYEITFKCNLVSGDAKKKTLTVHLHAPDEEFFWNVHIVIIASICVAVFVGFTVAMVTSCYLYYPQIVYHYKQRYDQLPKRLSDFEFEHDVTILCSEQNERFVEEEIAAKLKSFNYDVSTEKPNSLQISQKAEAIARSFCTMVIYSESELADNMFSHLFNIAATYNGLRMIVIEQEAIPATFWRRPRNHSDPDSQEQETLRHIPKILKTVKWPGNNCKNKRKIDNFWSEIRANLPVPKQQSKTVEDGYTGKTDVGANNPRRPLLSSGNYKAVVDVKSDDDVFDSGFDSKVDVIQNVSHNAKNNLSSGSELTSAS